MKALGVALGVVALMLGGSAGASKKCGNGWIADNKTCRVGTGTSAPSRPPFYATPAISAPVRRVFGSCDEAAVTGVRDIPSSSSEYQEDLDRDHDRIACESNGDDNMSEASAGKSTAGTPISSGANSSGKSAAGACISITSAPQPPVQTHVTVYEVASVPYVILSEFARAHGFGYIHCFGNIILTSTEKTLQLTTGSKEAFLNGSPRTLKANLLPIHDEVAASYTDMLPAFDLKAPAGTKPVPHVPLGGERP